MKTFAVDTYYCRHCSAVCFAQDSSTAILMKLVLSHKVCHMYVYYGMIACPACVLCVPQGSSSPASQS